MKVFKIWNRDETKKKLVVLDTCQYNLRTLLSKGNTSDVIRVSVLFSFFFFVSGAVDNFKFNTIHIVFWNHKW